MARRYFKVATFNVRNLISAGVTYYNTNRYSEAAYDRKVDWLAEQLADYKRPRQIVVHPEPLPRGMSGKVLKRDLRAPFWEGKERAIN